MMKSMLTPESLSLKLGQSYGAWIDTNIDKIYVLYEAFAHNEFLCKNIHLLNSIPPRYSNQDAALAEEWVRISHVRITELCIEGLLSAITKAWKHIGRVIHTPGLVRVYIDVIVFKDVRGTIRPSPERSFAFDLSNGTDRKQLERFVREDQPIL